MSNSTATVSSCILTALLITTVIGCSDSTASPEVIAPDRQEEVFALKANLAAYSESNSISAYDCTDWFVSNHPEVAKSILAPAIPGQLVYSADEWMRVVEVGVPTLREWWPDGHSKVTEFVEVDGRILAIEKPDYNQPWPSSDVDRTTPFRFKVCADGTGP